MPGKRFASYRPSLRRWSNVFAIVWLVGAGLTAPVSITLLDRISEDARSTYGREIPSLLDMNRKAIKLERLASFLRSVSSTRDPQVERRSFLRLQTLAQGFDMDDDARLNEAVAHVVVSARKIMALRATLRRHAAESPATGDPDRAARDLDAERAVGEIGDEAVQVLNSLTDHLTTDAALTADGMANRIQRNATRIKQGCLAALGFFVAFGFLFLWIAQRHVLTPIAVAVRGLEAISGSDDAPVELPRSRFFELDMIGRSVEQYARFAGDLRMANLALRTLSEQDGLTGLANRRSFDADLGEACRRSTDDAGRFALMLIDIDHFKSLNDRFGHVVGDQCLRKVAMTLQSFCSRRGNRASRYGGEEFAVILADASPDEAREIADQLRSTVERAQLYVSGARRAIDVTVSVGVAAIASGSADPPERVIEAADEALYRAKRDGRNRVCVSTVDGSPAAPSRSAA